MSATEFTDFLESHLAQVEPLSRQVNLAYWNATISGKPRDFVKYAGLQVKLQHIYSDQRQFERIRKWREDHSLTDEIELRQIVLLYHTYLRNQIDPRLNERITKLQSKIENQFNIYRATVNGRKATSNDILRILKESDDSNLRREAWEAGKHVGTMVKDDLVALVHMRNEAAGSLGYDNYYSMAMALSEQNESDIVNLFDELETLTREPFMTLKAEVDRRLTSRFKIGPDDIRPWHYGDPFFQEAPRIYSVNLDAYYSDRGILELVARFYNGIGLAVDEILSRSDLYEKPGKDQHAYCTDIDRNGDIRILANIRNDETWTGTMLHELGHAVHDRYIDPSLPYLLRQEAHIFTTEAIAMLFGRLSKDPEWIRDMIRITEEEKTRIERDLVKSLRLNQLIFARWSQVMFHFERQLYLDPTQNLSRLWWDLVNEFQMLTPPDNTDFPHWAAKTHIVSAPAYYHNYLLGEVLASQLDHHIRRTVLGGANRRSFSGQTSVGDYLKHKIFGPGARYRWDSLILQAVGEELSPGYFVREFVDEADR
jgi:peptidyl-dipeptidase A